MMDDGEMTGIDEAGSNEINSVTFETEIYLLNTTKYLRNIFSLSAWSLF